MIDLVGTRFGDLTVALDSVLTLRGGLLGFPNDARFVLLERARGPVAFLQSVDTEALAVPVLDAARLVPAYPTHSVETLARLAGVPAGDLAISVVVAVEPTDRSLRANLVAPIVVHVKSRKGAQIILPGSGYDTRTRVVLSDEGGAAVTARGASQRRVEAPVTLSLEQEEP